MKKILLLVLVGIVVLNGFEMVESKFQENTLLITTPMHPHSTDVTLLTDFSIGRIFEVDGNGTVIWEYWGASTPIDVERLANGNTLIAESYGEERVLEIDRDGQVIWQYTGEVFPFHPADVERLENGNTLITFGRLNQRGIIEVDYNGSIIWEYNCSGIFYTSDLERLPNGNTLMILHFSESDAHVVEVTLDGEVVWEYIGASIPSDAERLENGNTLIATHAGQVLEITNDGIVVWEYNGATSPIDVERLLNGNTLITDGGTTRVIEVEADGDIVWECSLGNEPTDAERINDGSPNMPPIVEIINPTEGYYHFRGNPVFPTIVNIPADTVSIGGFRYQPIIINASDDFDNASDLIVKIFLDGELQGDASYCCDWKLFEWFWTGFAIGKYQLMVTAEDSFGAVSSDTLEIWNLCVLP
jgi:Fe-S cluster biogenesis protein NfuA